MATVCVFVGDMHVGAKNALALTPTNPSQKWLRERWDETIKNIKKSLKGAKVYLMLGGDIVDEPGKDNRDAAVTLLRPLANLAKAVYAVTGTEYHAGPDAEDDRTVYDALGARADRQRRTHHLVIARRHLWWSHHAIAVGALPWTRADGLYRRAKECHFAALQYGVPAPALVVGHHIHIAPAQVGVYAETQAAIVPCWQLQTPYGARRGAFAIPTIGIMLWRVEEHRVEYLTHQVPDHLWSS